jgi:iron complex transport system substrate-binding protein
MSILMAFLMVLALLAGCAPKTADTPVQSGKPTRIVSMNPCVDAVLKEVADPKQIAAISHYSHDPRATSVSLDWAQRYPAVSGAAEDVIAAQPDLVIAGPHVAIQTIAALKRLGIPLMQIPVPETVAENKAQIAEIAVRIGRVREGNVLNARIDTALEQARSARPPVSALIWQGSGLVPGKGTLADELLTRTGFRNVSSTLGLQKWDILPLEGLLMQPPSVLLSGEADMNAGNADGNRMLSHPVLRSAGTRIHIANYPSNLLHCGGPVIVRSAARLAAVRRSLEARP